MFYAQLNTLSLTECIEDKEDMMRILNLIEEGGFKNIGDLKKFEEEVSIPLRKEDFVEALKNVNKSVGKEDLHKYEAWMKEFGTI